MTFIKDLQDCWKWDSYDERSVCVLGWDVGVGDDYDGK